MIAGIVNDRGLLLDGSQTFKYSRSSDYGGIGQKVVALQFCFAVMQSKIIAPENNHSLFSRSIYLLVIIMMSACK